jgi:hypothetical protein
MIPRRRPIPRFKLKPSVSQHYELILGGAVRRYHDGREVCMDSPAGWREYSRRIDFMLQRQNWRCCLCGNRIRYRNDATFEHSRRKGMGSAFRDDRVDRNGAAHWVCNVEKG